MMQSESEDNLSDKQSSTSNDSKNSPSIQKTGQDGKVKLNRSLPREEAIEEATAELFKHMTGRDLPS